MPCDSITIQSIDLSKCKDGNLLLSGLASVIDAGTEVKQMDNGDLRFYHNRQLFFLAQGKLQGPSTLVGQVADKIKQGYARASVYASAKKMGWQVKDLGNNKMQVIRRF